MFIMGNHYGRKCLSVLIEFEPFDEMFKVISGVVVQFYHMINTSIIVMNFCNAKKINCALKFIISNHYVRMS